ncbi:MAG TPA: response regulator [Candidatus Tectomicrobia bacterium]|jgi:CheY-like chemotaxis protein
MPVQTKKILLAEDDAVLRRACVTALQRRGWTVFAAVNGEEALWVIRTEVVDLVLLDMLMPKVKGIEVMRVLKQAENTRAIPVLILSNSSTERDIQEALRLGAVDYLVKSNLSLRELGDRVAQLLEE